MKIDRFRSHKFKKAKGLKILEKIAIRLTSGTIAVSSYFLFTIVHSNYDSFEAFVYSSTMYIQSQINEEPNEDIELITYNDNSNIVKEERKNIDTITVTPKAEPAKETKIEPKVEKKEAPKVKTEQVKKMVALSYDDGPSIKYTLELLKVLEENNCKATFFVLGNRVKKYSDIIYKINESGNEIGNHSYDHSKFTKLKRKQIIEQLKKTDDSIYKITKEHPTLFRPPYGAINDTVKECANSAIVLWSIDSNDWRKISDEQVIENVMTDLEDGEIILMHDIYDCTVRVSKILIPKIKEMGYEIVSIEELLDAKNIGLKNGCVYSKIKKIK